MIVRFITGVEGGVDGCRYNGLVSMGAGWVAGVPGGFAAPNVSFALYITPLSIFIASHFTPVV